MKMPHTNKSERKIVLFYYQSNEELFNSIRYFKNDQEEIIRVNN
jgi:hypothetical protein